MLKFNIKNQTLRRADRFRAAERSINYLKAEFRFLTDDWLGAEKTAVFRNVKEDIRYDVLLAEDSCIVPWEVLRDKGAFEVSLRGRKADVTLTTSIVTVDLEETLLGGGEANPPTPSELDKLNSSIEAINDRLDNNPIPEALPNPQPLEINSVEYDGTQRVSITIPAGADGLTPYIGVNENWWIGDRDTGFKAAVPSVIPLPYPYLTDNITLDFEAQEIDLDLELTRCKEARIYISVPANGSGSNQTYYLTSDYNKSSSMAYSVLTSQNSVTTGAIIHYKALTQNLGEFIQANNMRNVNLDNTGSNVANTNLMLYNAPRAVGSDLRLIMANETAVFPEGTRVITYAWY